MLIAGILALTLPFVLGNYLQNPGFEGGMSAWNAFGKGWRVSDWKNDTSSDAFSGSHGMVDEIGLSDTNEEWRAISQTVRIQAGLTYTAKTRIRTVQMGLSECYLEVEFLGAQTNVLKQFQSKHVNSDQPFALAVVSGVEVPRNAVSAVIRGVVHLFLAPRDAVGFHVFDDFEFDAVGNTMNPGFAQP